jgi:hypothetical protein
MLDCWIVGGGTVGASVLAVSLSFVTGGTDTTTGFLVSWITLGYFRVTGVISRVVENCFGTNTVAEFEFQGVETVSILNAVEAVMSVLLFKMFIGLVTPVLFNSDTAEFNLREPGSETTAKCGSMEVVIGFIEVNCAADLP